MRQHSPETIQRHSIGTVAVIVLTAVSEFLLLIYGGAFLWKSKSNGPSELPYIVMALFMGSDLLTRKYLVNTFKKSYSYKQIVDFCLLSSAAFATLLWWINDIYVSGIMLVLTGAAVGPVALSVIQDFTEEFGAGDAAIPIIILLVLFLVCSLIAFILVDNYVMVQDGTSMIPIQFVVCQLMAFVIKNTVCS